MMKQRTIFLVTFISLVIFITGCQYLITPNYGIKCIPPKYKLAIPQFITKGLSTDKDKIIYPGSDWEVIAKILPNYQVSGYPKLLFAKDKIFFLALESKSQDLLYVNKVILSYDIKNRTWEVFDSFDKDSDLGPDALFSDSNGRINSIEYSHSGNLIINSLIEATGKFKQLYRSNDAIISSGQARAISSPVKDDSGTIWISIINPEGKTGVIKFNSENPRMELVELPNIGSVYNMFYAKKKIWMIAFVNTSTSWEVLTLNPDDGQVSETGLLTDGSDYLFLDRESNLWVSDKYWVELSPTGVLGTKYEIIRSPAFIASNVFPDNSYFWERPDEMYQSSDGTYWFTSSAGMVQLDRNTEEWCLFTSGSSRVVEDGSKNVWIMIDGTLYKKKLK